MVGFRVFDVGLLIIWLVWFFRLRDDEDEATEEGGGDGGGGSPKPKLPRTGPGPGGLRLPDRAAGPAAVTCVTARSPARTPLRRRPAPALPNPLPARVRSPAHAQPRPAPRLTAAV